MSVGYKYPLTFAQSVKLRESQEHRCKICLRHENVVGQLLTDHCHKSGAVRGALCKTCNALLGFAKDDIEILWRAILYIGEKDPFIKRPRVLPANLPDDKFWLWFHMLPLDDQRELINKIPDITEREELSKTVDEVNAKIVNGEL